MTELEQGDRVIWKNDYPYFSEKGEVWEIIQVEWKDGSKFLRLSSLDREYQTLGMMEDEVLWYSEPLLELEKEVRKINERK